MPMSEKKPPQEGSKSRRKEELLIVQSLGKQLVELPATQLAKIPVPDELLEAIHLAHALKSREAKRRHLHYIGKMMREMDLEPIRHALQQIKLTNAVKTNQFHDVEKWRDELIAENDVALQKFMMQYTNADRQYMRQLIRKARQDDVTQKNSGAATELFRYLRSLFTEN